jgi:hypothetical protein
MPDFGFKPEGRLAMSRRMRTTSGKFRAECIVVGVELDGERHWVSVTLGAALRLCLAQSAGTGTTIFLDRKCDPPSLPLTSLNRVARSEVGQQTVHIVLLGHGVPPKV